MDIKARNTSEHATNTENDNDSDDTYCSQAEFKLKNTPDFRSSPILLRKHYMQKIGTSSLLATQLTPDIKKILHNINLKIKGHLLSQQYMDKAEAMKLLKQSKQIPVEDEKDKQVAGKVISQLERILEQLDQTEKAISMGSETIFNESVTPVLRFPSLEISEDVNMFAKLQQDVLDNKNASGIPPSFPKCNESASFANINESMLTNWNFVSKNSNIVPNNQPSSTIFSLTNDSGISDIGRTTPKKRASQQSQEIVKKLKNDENTDPHYEELFLTQTQQSSNNFIPNTKTTDRQVTKTIDSQAIPETQFSHKDTENRQSYLMDVPKSNSLRHRKPSTKRVSKTRRKKNKQLSNSQPTMLTYFKYSDTDKITTALDDKFKNSQDLRTSIPENASPAIFETPSSILNEIKLTSGKKFLPVNEADLQDTLSTTLSKNQEFAEKFFTAVKIKSEEIQNTKLVEPKEQGQTRYKNLFDSSDSEEDRLPELFNNFTLCEEEKLKNQMCLDAIATYYEAKYDNFEDDKSILEFVHNDDDKPLPNWEAFVPKYTSTEKK